MDFLNRLKNKIFPKKKKNTFQEQIRAEKQKKYLFRPEEEDIFVSPRNQKKNIFGKVTQKKPQNAYTNFFQKSFNKIARDGDLSHIVGAIAVLLFSLVGYIVFFSPYFKISASKVLVEPLSDGVDTAIVQRSIEGLYGQSIFTLDEATTAKKIKDSLPNTEYIKIDRLFPNGAKILIRSMSIPFDATIYGVENKRFGVSANGVLVPLSDIKNPNFTRHLQLISKDLQEELFFGYKKVISDRQIFTIGKIFELFEKQWTDLIIARANFFALENELHVTLESNTKIIFSLYNEENMTGTEVSENLLGQLVTLQTYIQNHRAKLIDGSVFYLDARIPGKIFACAEEYNCYKNLVSVYGKAYE